MKSEEKSYGEYTIGGKKYFQYPMVGGQSLAFVEIILDVLKANPDIFKKGRPGENRVDKWMSALNSVSTSYVHRLFGVSLLADGEKQEDLADVRDFEARGRRIAFGMGNDTMIEVVSDFFVLGRPELAKILARFGGDLDKILESASGDLDEMRSKLSKSSPTDGDKAPSA